MLILAVILGTAANGFAKGADGFTLLIPSLLTAITIVGCMFTLSIVMKTIPVGITYASFAGLCIVATTFVGIYKFNQMPDLYTIITYINTGMDNEYINRFLKAWSVSLPIAIIAALVLGPPIKKLVDKITK